MKVRITLKAVKNSGTTHKGDTLVIYNEIFDPKTGVGFYPVDRDKWEVVACDMFSGLISHNKQELYQDDVIRSYDSQRFEMRHVIKYDPSEGRFITELLPRGFFPYTGGINQRWIDEFEKEKIGNIRENPELLK